MWESTNISELNIPLEELDLMWRNFKNSLSNLFCLYVPFYVSTRGIFDQILYINNP
jgi:hypothetical protein